MRRVLACTAAVLLLSLLPSAAQFYSAGNEPATVRWKRIDVGGYRVIYPAGRDSLARVYAGLLGRAEQAVGTTAGYAPNQNYRRPLPVILHPWTAHANGLVTWSPRRMELYTTPDFSAPLPLPWEQHLVIHESRHVAQMQFTTDPVYRVWNAIFGQLFAGAVSAVYGGPSFYEGDAVAAETALTASGRGRNAAFLEYWRSCFLDGDTRGWWQWRYGSLRKHTPDYYTVGYVTAAGLSELWDAPDFTARYYQRIFRMKAWPWPLFNFQGTVKEVTGKKFASAFGEICDSLSARWGRDAEARGPEMSARRIVPAERHYVDYGGAFWLDSTLCVLRSGDARVPRMQTASGRRISSFSYNTSAPKPSAEGRVFWSEIVRDPRWEMKSYSEVWYSLPDGRKHRLKARTRWYNPAPGPDWKLAVVESEPEGGTRLLVLSSSDGTLLESHDAPSGMQLVEPEWGVDGRLYVSAITDEGAGIWLLDGSFRRVLGCGYSAVKGLFSHGGYIYFTSDLDGVDELYRLDSTSGEAWRITSTRTGGGSFRFSPGGDTLVFTAVKPEGRFLYATPTDSLPAPVRADFRKIHRYELASETPVVLPELETEPGEPAPYNRLANLFRVHSWAPIYVNYDAVESLSFESVSSGAGLGATAFFQNDLSTLDGTVAYNAAYNSGGWNHKLEAKFNYRGLYPVFEGSVALESDPARHYYMYRYFSNFGFYQSFVSEKMDGVPSVYGSLKVYVPLSFSSGGWYRGVVPQLQLSLSNSMLTRGGVVPMSRLSASLRGYVVSPTPAACIYPKLGLGAEVGYSARLGTGDLFSPNVFGYLYGYLPGLMDTHGIRLAWTLQKPLREDCQYYERYATIMPRGMLEQTELATSLASAPLQSRLCADYAFPFAPLDYSGLCPVAYVRNLECTLHADWSWFAAVSGKQAGRSRPASSFGSIGADLCAVLGNLLWIPYDTRIGISYYYNFGMPPGSCPHYIGAVFSVDM